jgi:hypothetical protein
MCRDLIHIYQQGSKLIVSRMEDKNHVVIAIIEMAITNFA